ncbi:MAG: sugar phosphate isomerase/epimerase [Anaerolineaceae bacterium]|nr:sugar phosphate isomerase/epimerase [Anaerolineaceae bacterium]
MDLQFAFSLWNFNHLNRQFQLADVADFASALNFGVELWPSFSDIDDLFTPQTRADYLDLFKEIPTSLHTRTNQNQLSLHQAQIDAARDYGARVVVLHSDDFYQENSRKINAELIAQACDYAEKAGIQLALENGQFVTIQEMLACDQRLKFCLDLGHVFLVPETLEQFLNAFQDRLIHVHIHDFNPKIPELIPPYSDGLLPDHHIPGFGTIPSEIWQTLFASLEENNFSGSIVLEICPANPFQAILLGMQNLDGILNQSGLSM